MEYNLRLNGETARTVVERTEDNNVRITIDDRVYTVTASRTGEKQLNLVVNGKIENVYTDSGDPEKLIFIKGESYAVEDADRADSAGKSRKKATGIPDTVTPPMPSIVVAVLVSEGDHVTKGQGVIVVSAMKMETTLVAPYDGTVKKIGTATGEKVNPGDILVDIEKDEEQGE